jgi:hypothetical protein
MDRDCQDKEEAINNSVSNAFVSYPDLRFYPVSPVRPC